MRLGSHPGRFFLGTRAVFACILLLMAQAAMAQSPGVAPAVPSDPAQPTLKARAFLQSESVREVVVQALHLFAIDRGQTCGQEASPHI